MIRKTALPLPIIVSLLILFTSFYLIVILDEDCMFKASTITTIMLSYIKTEECPDGHYCPAGTGYPFTYPCQAGKYRNNTLGQSGEACILCPSRHYCSSPGTHTPSVCPQVRIRLLKKFCCMGETVFKCACICLCKIHQRHKWLLFLFCASVQGFYCPDGTSVPEPCPEGTYSSRSALSDRSECTPCGGGQYCTGVGLSEPSGSCRDRFYCREGAKSAVC